MGLPMQRLSATGGAVPTIQIAEAPPTNSELESAPVTLAIPTYTLSAGERDTVASCLVLEAANQGEFGMRSVMAVIRNRAGGRAELLALTVLRQKQFTAFNKLTAGRETL